MKIAAANPTAVSHHGQATPNQHYFVIEFVSGAIGGIISRTATAPIDRIRTFLQVYSVEQNASQLKLRFVLNHMIKEGSYLSLWRGNLVNVLKTAPENAIKLVAYEQFKEYMRKTNSSDTNTVKEKFLCGSMAGLLAQFTLYPLKTVKVMMNLRNTNEYKSIADCIVKLYKRHGIKAFYRGLVPNSLAIMPCSGIDLAAYETLKLKYSQWRNKNEPNVFERLVIGNISSGLGNLVVYPMLVLRTRLQSNRNLNETTVNLFRQVWKAHGIAGMYRGFLLHILKIGPCASISYITFEYFNKIFNINSLV
jgi:solute carrier family 25 phosphate transporter 23/24/25/41